MTKPCGLLLADDAALGILEEALQNAERWADDSALVNARMALSLALMNRDSSADRERGLALVAKVREFSRMSRPYGRSSTCTRHVRGPGVATATVPCRCCAQPQTISSILEIRAFS